MESVAFVRPNPDKLEQVAAKALKNKEKLLVDILFFESLCLGGKNIFS
jgi:hypothetical protein